MRTKERFGVLVANDRERTVVRLGPKRTVFGRYPAPVY
jgi:hypothetical protein